MNRFIALLFALGICTILTAQTKIRFDGNLTAITVIPAWMDDGLGYGGNIGMGIELDDRYMADLELEFAVVTQGVFSEQTMQGEVIEIGTNQVYRFGIIGGYRFGDPEKKARPFAMLGLGSMAYTSTSLRVTDTSEEIEVKVGGSFVITPKVGIDLGVFRLAASYHLATNKRNYIGVTIGDPPYEPSNNYLAFHLGFHF